MLLFPAQFLRSKLFGDFSPPIAPVWLIFVFFICCPPISAERLPVKTYTVADGLLRDEVVKIKRDSRGFLWFCTGEGVSRFDGYAFKNFTTDDGLPERHANDFLETKIGGIYIATGNGLAALNPRGDAADDSYFSTYLPDNPKANAVNVLYKDVHSTVFVGTSDGLYKFDEKSLIFEAVDIGKPLANYDAVSVTAILEDEHGAVWVGTEDNGLRRVSPSGEVRIFTHDDGLGGNSVFSLFEDADKRIWAGMRLDKFGGGLNLLKGETDADNSIVERHFSSKDGLTSDWVTNFLQTGDGEFWIGTTAGLCRWQGANEKSVCKNYHAANGICDYDVWTISQDENGNLWTGSRCGATKISRYGFTTYDESDGNTTEVANSFFENSAGDFFVTKNGSKGRTIYRFDGVKFVETIPQMPFKISNFGWGWKQTVLQDRENSWWIPTAHGVFRFPVNTAFKNLDETMPQNISPPTMSDEIFRIYEDSRGDVWVSTLKKNGLWRWERGANVWHDYADLFAADSASQAVTAFVEDQSGNLWIGTGADGGGELLRYRNGNFDIFTKKDDLICGWIRDLYVDKSNRLWIANTKTGLLRLDDVNAETLNFKRYARAEGLSSAAALSVTEDVFGRIYVGTPRGVDRLNADTGQIENFTTADGLPASYTEIAYRDRQNNLWFGTSGGLTRFVPEPKRERKPPTILITALRVNGEPQKISITGETEITKIELNAEQKQMSVDFVGLGASLGEQLKYEYRFGGGDWTQTNERTVNFANLASGSYRFEVRAQTADLLTSAPAAVSFKIDAPIYLRPWFLIAAFLIFGGAIFSVYRYRVSRLLEMERMRTRIATDLHDDIGANLTKISILSEVARRRLGNGADDDDGANLLENIAETSRESISAMSDIVWAINPKKDSPADLTSRMRRHAEELLERREIKLEFHAAPSAPDLKLDADLRRNIYLIFKESLNNIVRHAAAENVEIDLSFAGGALTLKIADDGRGFETNDEYDGNGLASMRKRAAELGADLQINSSPTNGTNVILRVESAKKIRA